MRYEISYENNGYAGSQFVMANSAAEAIENFIAGWSDYDTFTGSCWVSAVWSIEG